MPRPLLAATGFWVLVVSRAAGTLSIGATTVALTVLAVRSGPTAVGLVLLAATVPALAGPLAGAVADRVQPRILLAGCEGGQAVLLVVLAAALPPLPALIAVAGLRGVLVTLFSPAGRVVVPALVPTRSVDRAYSLLSAVNSLQVVAGPALGGLLVSVGGVRTAFAVAAGLSAAGAAVLVALPRLPRGESRARLLAEARQGVGHVAADRVLRVLALALLAFVAFAALDNVALVFLVAELGSGPAAYGVLVAFAGLGLVLGSLGLAAWRGPLPAGRLFLGAALVEAVGLAGVGLAPGLALAAVGQILAGAGNGVDLVVLDVLVQRSAPPALLGRVFGTLSTTAQLGVGIAAGGGGLLVDAVGPRSTLLVAAVGSAGVCLLRAPLLRAPEVRKGPRRHAGEAGPPLPPGP